MSKVVTPRGLVGPSALWPASFESRIVSCSYSLEALGGSFWSYTERTAQNLWLLGIDLLFTLKPGGAATAVSFDVFTGFNEPASFEGIRNWRNLLPVYYRGQLSSWLVDSENQHFHWAMKLYLEGIGRRFGFSVVGTNTEPGYMVASFQISEG